MHSPCQRNVRCLSATANINISGQRSIRKCENSLVVVDFVSSLPLSPHAYGLSTEHDNKNNNNAVVVVVEIETSSSVVVLECRAAMFDSRASASPFDITFNVHVHRSHTHTHTDEIEFVFANFWFQNHIHNVMIYQSRIPNCDFGFFCWFVAFGFSLLPPISRVWGELLLCACRLCRNVSLLSVHAACLCVCEKILSTFFFSLNCAVSYFMPTCDCSTHRQKQKQQFAGAIGDRYTLYTQHIWCMLCWHFVDSLLLFRIHFIVTFSGLSRHFRVIVLYD